MTSSMLAGERRWASARRGGMTVLGKVAVPKPINLPSQKLENHGLDPNVEIVPKGSLSWGSRPSSVTSNPWGSSAVSPNADGTNVSPHHPSGRPSSGGGLSRPSTAGSDRHEPSATTWRPSSRPSSASGVLTSNQSSLTSSRPLSAETRPGSSHLSRFAEPAFDNSMAWGPNGTADKMSIPTKVNDFSLSSGDFPTLGSEKDITAKNSETHDHGSHVRPGSCSGRTAPPMDRNEMFHVDHKSETVDTWTRDSSPHFEDGVRPSVGKWQGDPHQYMSPNVPPQHFDAWRGPPMNAPPAGVWYRGPPPAGPYPPVPHGGYPMEPFPYYRPQIPSNLANPQSGPPPGPGPRGHHPRNGDFYRPQMPDAFIRPGMPIRPGFYPGPVPYDGYYGPPMGYNPNDRDIPFMGMPPGPQGPHGPPVYNMGPPQNPSELNEAHFRGSGHGSGGNVFVSEQLGSIPPEESGGPYKVLRKPNHERHADMEEDNWEQNLDKSDQPRPSFHKNERRVETRRNEDMPSRRNLGNQGHPSDSVIVHSHEGPHKSKPSNESLGNKSSFPEVHQDISAKSKDPSLIQKIEGLNAKVQASDGSGVVREEQKNRLLINPNHKENSTTIAFGTISDIGDLNTSKSTTASASLFSRQTHHGVRSQPDHHSKGRLNNQDTDGWQKKPPVLGSVVPAENSETKNTDESLTPMTDPADGQAQRARMRELAKQRAIQLQKEEEERIREQKAKALAKLDELNRRTLAAADGTTQTAEKTVNTVHIQEDVDGFQKPFEPAIDDNKHEEPAVQDSENSQQEPVDQPLVSKQSVANATDAEIKAAPLGNDGNIHKQKRSGHGQNQGVQMVESSVVKSTLNAVIKNSGTNVTVPGEDVPSQQSSHLNISNISFESTQQRKRNNKSGKNKHKLDDASASKEGDLAKTESPQFDSNSSNVLVTDGKDAMQSNLEQISSLPSNQFKPQHPRRMPRNPQANRAADRFHVGDVAVWAPVRTQNKEECVDEYSQRTQQDDVALRAKTINSGQTDLKNKRAEMERYVPKPVAKELAQQGTGNQSASLSSPEKTALEDMTDREDLGSQLAIPVSVSMGSTVESKVGDNKQNKQVKSHGAWKQRGPTDLNRDQGFQQDSKNNYQKSTSHQHEPANPVPADLNRDQGFQQDTKRNYQKSMSQHEPTNPVPIQQDSKKTYQKSMNRHEPVNPFPTETTVMHEWDPSDGWFMPDEVPPVTSVVKDEGGATGKGKKLAYKGQRNTVKNHNVDHKDISGAEVEIDQTERPVSSKENRSSQWQPQTQSYKGGWSGGGQNANLAVKPEEPIAEYKNVRRAPHERKQASFRGQANSSNQGFGNMEDEGSDFKKYCGQNNRPGGQDNRRQHNQHNANVNRERQRQNLHYVYQPVGSNHSNTNKSSNHDAPAADGSDNAGPRYKESCSGQSRHGGGGGGGSGSGSEGNFYGQQ